MSTVENTKGVVRPSGSVGWREMWLKEDWWAIWLGLGQVVDV
jgi:hypothetical protein